MISQRDAFFASLFDLASADRRVVLITADCGAPALDRWRTELPNQFYNCGIAEQGGLSVAGGLALEGKRPYFYAIAPFATLRCLEQIRINLAIMRLPIVIVGVGAGLSYEDSGPTHHAIEDLAIMRALPGLTIWNLTDSVMAAKVAGLVYEADQPAYVRMDREVREPIYNEHDRFESGMIRLSAGDYGNRIDILATGNMVYEAYELARKHRIGCVDIYRFPINGSWLGSLVKGSEAITTVEEHYLPGGLGSAVAEALADQGLKIPLHRVGLEAGRPYGCVYGGREVIRKEYGIGYAVLEEILLKNIGRR